MGNMLEDLSERQSLQHVNIDIEYDKGADFSHYDSRLADMVMKLSSLRSLKVKIGVLTPDTPTMAELSNRARLYIKINDNLSEDDVKKLRATLTTDGHMGQAKAENATPLEIFNMLEMDNKIGKGNLALLVDLLKALSKTKLAQEAEDVAKGEEEGEIRHMSGKVKDAIFEQLLPEDTNMTPDQLWSYIQENQDDVLFILDGLDELSQTARESTDVVALIQEGHQEIIDQLMRNKPANFEELRITMFKSEQYAQLTTESTESPGCSTDSISSELIHVNPSTSTGVSGHRYDLRSRRSSKRGEVDNRSRRGQSLENTMKRKKKQKR
ncbi:Hypp4059 [Branchiostoma lanceolatum]|uniref:Hypp4059 protein n=1 Tax=Branchiostoma lanceolatum TaxID=7740 RepID=A0A8K0EZL1_BRALA|nr:Hypp4059 [Branchiostoma lanceolatum]